MTSARQLSLSCARSIHSIHPHPTYWISILLLPSHLRLSLPSGLFPLGFPNENVYAPRLCSYVLLASPISFFSISSPEKYLVRSTDYSAPHYVVFSTPLLPRPSQDQIFSSAPYSQISSAYIFRSMWRKKFHTHTKQKAKFWFRISSFNSTNI